MKERPILFKGELVRAILAGTKTQTRRLINPQPAGGVRNSSLSPTGLEDGHGRIITLKYGRPGDRLWVRETWQAWMAGVSEYDDGDPLSSALLREGVPACFEYQAGPTDSLGPWRPSIHMPRRASRIDLEIVEVRVQRLQDITEEDARAEGVPGNEHVEGAHRRNFASLWDAINGARASWDSNPWVWAISF